MILEILILISIFIIFVILARRLPDVIGEGEKKVYIPKAESHMKIKEMINKIKKISFRASKKPELLNFENKNDENIENEKIVQMPTSEETKSLENAPLVENINVLFHRADELFDSGKLRQAENIYIEIAAREPKNQKVYNRLGIIYLEQKNYRDAKEAFSELLHQDDSVATRHFNLALSLWGLGELEPAKDSLKRAIKIDPSNKKYIESLEEIKKEMI